MRCFNICTYKSQQINFFNGKFLGIYLDTLKWIFQITNLVDKLSSAVFTVRKIPSKIPNK